MIGTLLSSVILFSAIRHSPLGSVTYTGYLNLPFHFCGILSTRSVSVFTRALYRINVSWTELMHRTEWFIVSYVFWSNTIKQVCLVEIHRQSAMATSFIMTQVITQPLITPAMEDTVWIQLQSRDAVLRNAGKASLLDAVSRLLQWEVRVG